jgi:hypothetical protein
MISEKETDGALVLQPLRPFGAGTLSIPAATAMRNDRKDDVPLEILLAKPESQTIEAMNVTSMLEYSKMILERVSFHPYLFKKEYRKALRRLQPVEADSLRTWVRTQRSNSRYNAPIL